MKPEERCCEDVPWRGVGFGRSSQCARRGIVERGGKLYCKQHDPLAVKERREASWTRYKAKLDADSARADQRARIAEEHEMMVRLLIESRALLAKIKGGT